MVSKSETHRENRSLARLPPLLLQFSLLTVYSGHFVSNRFVDCVVLVLCPYILINTESRIVRSAIICRKNLRQDKTHSGFRKNLWLATHFWINLNAILQVEVESRVSSSLEVSGLEIFNDFNVELKGKLYFKLISTIEEHGLCKTILVCKKWF